MIAISFRDFLYGEQENSLPMVRARCLDQFGVVGRFVSFDQWLQEAANGTPSCPRCGSSMTLRNGKYGAFYGCNSWRQTGCKGTAKADGAATAPSASPATAASSQSQSAPSAPQQQPDNSPNCPKCGGPMTLKTARKGRNAGGQFWSCNGWKYGGGGCDGTMGYSPGHVFGADQATAPEKAGEQSSGATNFTEPEEVATRDNSMIPEHLISDEQRAIDEKFGRMRASSNTGHMMVSALAGSGKTTLLRHLAWKHGKPGENWLYLVFNSKNKVEATEKFPSDWVKVRTTHGFLGSEELLGHELNRQKIAQTDRIANLKDTRGRDDDDDEGKQNLDKASIIADSDEFAKVMNGYGIVTKKLNPDKDDVLGNVIETLKASIQYQFKKQVLTLLGLCKSFAIDPRNEQALKKGMDNVLQNYDFDTSLTEVKDRIAGYKSRFQSQVTTELKRIMGYDFMAKDFHDEIKKTTIWLLKETMPNATQVKFGYGKDAYGKSMMHELGKYRDFDDDLWFAAVHADEIHWPKFDVVLADEVQDFNEAQIKVLQKLAGAGAQVVAVGDKKQALYRFRGAHSQGFDSIGKMLGDMSHPEHRKGKDGKDDVVKKLTRNFRSRKAVIDFHNAEQQGTPGFTDDDKLVQGKYVGDADHGTATKYQIKYPEAFDTIKQEKAAGKIKETAFIARTNQPLVHTALQLLTAGVPFVMTGKDIAGDLLRHIKSTIKRYRLRDNNYSMDLLDKMHEFHNQQSGAHAASASKAAYVQNLKETTDALLAAIDQFHNEAGGRPTIAEFKQWIAEKLGKNSFDVQDNEKDFKAFRSKVRKEQPVVLTTAHRAKGLEWDRVFILRYDQFPHKKAKRPEDLEQESNSKGVALGRAKHEIHVLDLDDQPGYEKKGS